MTPSETLEPDDAAVESDETTGEHEIDEIEGHIPPRTQGELGSFAEHAVPMGGRMVG
jgi:hypothetical protein